MQTQKNLSLVHFLKKIIIAAIVVFNIAFIGIANEIHAADSRYGSTQPIQSIFDNNAAKMSKARNLKSVSPNELLYYVVDPITDEATAKATLEEIKSLSNSLVQGKGSEYAKIKALADYVGDNIAYDLDAAHNYVGFDEICLRNVLDRKRSTCAGFANLFSALCNAQGIYCVNVRGASPGDGISWSNLDDPNAPRNHEWTAVWYKAESRWMYIDCTWNSTSRFENGSLKKGKRTDTFFDLSEERFAIEHKAMLVDYRDFQSAMSLFTTPTTAAPKTTPTTVPTTKKPVLSTAAPNPSGNKNSATTKKPATEIITSISYIDDDPTKSTIVSEVVTVTTSTEVNSDGEVDSDGEVTTSTEIKSDAGGESGGLSGVQIGIIATLAALVIGGGVTFAVLRKKGL